jgi:sigma-B regulation protein RsbU (phosphoserine phosphatase)
VAVSWLGRKLSGDEYDAPDREYLTSVSQLAADAFERIRLRVLERDATRAWEIQQQMLPTRLPQLPGLTIRGSCQPARFVAGDYYDALQLGAHTVAVCIGDVVGKGVPAALLMSNLQGCLRSCVTETLSPATICGTISRMIAGNIRPGEFITFFYAVVDAATHTLRCTNAGHNPPMLFRLDGSVLRFDKGGFALGMFPEKGYEQQEVVLTAGDRLLMFTDGVTESCGPTGEEFGDDRLIEIGRAEADAGKLHRRVVDAVKAFRPGEPQDDVTVVTLGLQ